MQPQDFQDTNRDSKPTLADLSSALYEEALAEFGDEATAHRVSTEILVEMLSR